VLFIHGILLWGVLNDARGTKTKIKRERHKSSYFFYGIQLFNSGQGGQVCLFLANRCEDCGVEEGSPKKKQGWGSGAMSE